MLIEQRFTRMHDLILSPSLSLPLSKHPQNLQKILNPIHRLMPYKGLRLGKLNPPILHLRDRLILLYGEHQLFVHLAQEAALGEEDCFWGQVRGVDVLVVFLYADVDG